MDMLALIKHQLTNENLTCVAARGEIYYEAVERGIMPILSQLERDKNFFEGAYVGDKVVGKSAALLYIKGKVKGLYTQIISEHALEVLKKWQIPVVYEEKVPYIINRRKDGMCPMEASVLEISQPEEAYEILKSKVACMKKNR